MLIEEFRQRLANKEPVLPGSDLAQMMFQLSEEAIQRCMQLNTQYMTQAERVQLMSEITGRNVPESFLIFPPFTTDCGKNIKLGERVFINSGCRFQDQGGITIGDDTFIGHNSVLATLNHDLNPYERATIHPAAITIGERVWIGANVTILAGVTVGSGSIIAAGAVVSKDVPENVVVGGVPAKKIRDIDVPD